MKMMSVATLFLCLAGCATGRLIPTWGDDRRGVSELKAQTTHLQRGMSKQGVIDLLGRPDEMSGDLCGRAVGPEWKCINWMYGTSNRYMSLTVVFQEQTDGSLNVTGWFW